MRKYRIELESGNVLSLKNNKMLVQGKRMITQPKAYKQQKEIVSALESLFLSDLAELTGKTLTELSEQFWIVYAELVEEYLTGLPKDDNFFVINELFAKGVSVKKGNEFIEILIEELEPA